MLKSHLLGVVLFALSVVTTQVVADDAYLDQERLPTYQQMMNLNPAERAQYFMGLRKILVEFEKINKGKSGTLFVYEQEPRPDYQALLNLLSGFMPEATAEPLSAANPSAASPGGPNAPDQGAWVGKPESYFKNGKYYAGTCDQISGYGTVTWCTHTKRSDSDPIYDSTAVNKQIADSRQQAAQTQMDDIRKNWHDPKHPGNSSGSGTQLAGSGKANTNAGSTCDGKADDKTMQTYRQHGGDTTCIYAGNMSTYQDNTERKAGSCKKVSSMCLTSSCTGDDKVSCSGAKPILCNPMIFGFQKDGKHAYCVKAGGDATQACNDAAPPVDMGQDDFTKKFSSDVWRDYADKFNAACVQDSEVVAAFCMECKALKVRLAALNLEFHRKLMKNDGTLNDDLGSARSSH